jgi:hypothetical protein
VRNRDVIEATLRLPAHLNVNAIEPMPVQQSIALFAASRLLPISPIRL